MPLDPVIGQIMPAAFNYAPKGWMLCQGQTLAIAQYQALFSLIGTYYGGNGTSNFALPDLRDRAILGQSSTYPLGSKVGLANVTLTVDQIPAHSHYIMATTANGPTNRVSPSQAFFATNTRPTPSAPIQIFAPPGSAEVILAESRNVLPSGGSAPHTNTQPSLVINYMIAYSGIFPSRL